MAGFSLLVAHPVGPRHPKADPRAHEQFKKTFQHRWKRPLVSSEGKSAFFAIRWLPTVYALSIEDGRIAVDLNGPLNTSVVLDIMDIDRTILASVQLACRGERYMASFELPSLGGTTSQGYIVPRYVLTDNTPISEMKQWRIPLRPKTFLIPEAWLQAGIGISGNELFTSLVLDA